MNAVPLDGLRLRPNDTLLRPNTLDPLVCELLNSLSLIRFGRVDVAPRVRRDTVHREPLAGLPSTVTELGEDLERLAIHDVHVLVLAVGEIDVLLRRVLRKR